MIYDIDKIKKTENILLERYNIILNKESIDIIKMAFGDLCTVLKQEMYY